MKKSRRKKKVCPECDVLFTGMRRRARVYVFGKYTKADWSTGKLPPGTCRQIQLCSEPCRALFEEKTKQLAQLASVEL